ncbi:MAG: hypothetical protein AAF799_18575 [Myxococcota bacterium]
MLRTIAITSSLFAVLALPVACGGEDVKLAPKAEQLEEAQPKSAAAMEWMVQSGGSKVGFEMQAPFERQEGSVPDSALSGSLHIDLHDLTQSTGLIAVDISDLEIFMQKAEEAGKYGEREKSELQNEHMQDWLEIGDDAPADQLAKNRRVQFSLQEVVEASASPASLSGAERKVELTVKGEFLLHQHKVEKTVDLSATFHYDGDRPTRVDVKTRSPFAVALPEHDVRPRTGFGALAKKTLGALSDKVGEEAQVSLSFSASPKAS